MTSLLRTCKDCKKSFDSISACLAHEMVAHVKLTEERKRRPRKRPHRSPKLKLHESDDYIALREQCSQNIQYCQPGSELSFLADMYQPKSDNLFEVYERILEDLGEVVTQLGNYKIQPFGSAIIGITLRDSDIDLYVEPPANKKSRKHFSKIFRVISNSTHFSNAIAIWQARVPIVKCVHSKTGYALDINTSCGHGVYNSLFLEKLIKSDSRFQPAILVLRIWAKHRAINTIGGLNSYCLALLFFFYLQNMKMFPSFEKLQLNATPVIFEDINFGFDPEALTMPNDGASVRELVEGFFQFYDKFDFTNKIVCPYLGIAITNEFLNEESFPEYHDQLQLLKTKQSSEDKPENIALRPSSMVVQDPFCLYQNTSKSVCLSLLQKFQKHISATNAISSESQNDSISKWLVNVLYVLSEESNTEPQPQVQRPNKPKKNIIEKESVSTQKPSVSMQKPSVSMQKPSVSMQKPSANNSSVKEASKLRLKLSPLEQELFYIRNHLMQEFADKKFTLSDISKIWSEKVLEYLKLILTEILNLQVEVIESKEDYDFKAKILAKQDVWSNRELTKKTTFGNLLKEQILLTETLKSTRMEREIFISATVTMKIGQDFKIDVDLCDDLGSKSKNLFNFYSDNVRILLKGYLEKNLTKRGKFQLY